MSEKGLSLIEAMVAAVIVGIGFVAVYGLTSASTRVLVSSIDREKANMLSSMIMEDLLTDKANISTCPTTCNYDDLDFTSAAAGSTNNWDLKQSKWFLAANSSFGTATANDIRLIEVDQVGTTNQFTISITLHARNGESQNRFKRILNAQ